MTIRLTRKLRSRLILWAVLFASTARLPAQPRVLETNHFHLGVAGNPEWQWFEGQTVFSNRLDVRFPAEQNGREATLFIRQEDVKLEWTVKLNGQKLGTLFLSEQPLIHTLSVPPRLLRDGENVLSVLPPDQPDDIIIGDISLNTGPVETALTTSQLEVRVCDKSTGVGIPCRITIVNERNDLAPIYPIPGQALAVRPGVAYTRDGQARLGLLPGKYSVYATRGFEYGLDQQSVTLAAGDAKSVRLQIAREVPTPGWLACDTHVHTATYARHGDATIEERMLTLAGEGLELPISSEHNLLIDFSEPARKMEVGRFFTPVVGCEVTTDFGHFNAFPIEPGGRPPDHHLRDWPALMKSIRSLPGAPVVVLNHPRDVHAGFRPFAAANFNSVSGENLRGPEFTFDAVEVINSGAMQSDWMLPFRDWFALLNRGYRVTAVAASDSHDVSRFIVGQGRTYIAVSDSDPAHTDVARACESFRRGRALLSLGLLANMKVNHTFGVGDLATGLDSVIQVEVEVRAPGWVEPDRVELFANGTCIREARLESGPQKGNARADRNPYLVSWSVPRFRHDVYLVVIASGPGVTAAYWPMARPYQPSSRAWEPRVIGATNPIWIDGDGDGKFSSARSYATDLFHRLSPDPVRLLAELEIYDEAVCVQAASLCQSQGFDIRGEIFGRALKASSVSVRSAFAALLATLPSR